MEKSGQFIIRGGKKLKGEITVNSSKNAAVALLMASIINKGKTTLKNVPQIEEVNRLIEVMESIGIRFSRKKRSLTIMPPDRIRIEKLNKAAAAKTRSIIMLIGALSGQLKKYSIPQAGGCRLGSRTVKPHIFALENLGVKIKNQKEGFGVEAPGLIPGKKIVLYESGDTVTENALMAAAQAGGWTEIHLASANYMVRDLCFFLEKLDIKIEGVGTNRLKVRGKKSVNKNIEYEIGEDPIEAMFFLSVAAATGSRLLIRRCPVDFLELELLKLEKMGFRYKIARRYLAKNGRTNLADIETFPSKLIALEEKIHPLPSAAGINIDNLPFFVPVAIFAKGETLVHDWVYENRATYFTELNKLGAKITLMDPHRVLIEGPKKLSGAQIKCPPALRPGAIILTAMLAAGGKSILKDIYHIERGYENLVDRLQELGADIERAE